MKNILIIICFLSISCYGQESITIDTNKTYTLNEFKPSPLMLNNNSSNEIIKPLDLKSVNNQRQLKYTPYKPTNREIYLGEIGYLIFGILSVL